MLVFQAGGWLVLESGLGGWTCKWISRVMEACLGLIAETAATSGRAAMLITVWFAGAEKLFL